jgi:urea transporter
VSTTTVSGKQSLSVPANFVRVVLRGIGQVMFQDHAGTGLLFLIGIAIASPTMAVGALIGAIIGPATAILARFDHDEIEAGIYGFNSVLLGIGSLFYLQPWPLTWALVVVGSIVAACVTYLMRRYLGFPTYTAPFVVVTWIVILVAHAAAGTAIDVIPAPVSDVPVRFITQVFRGTAEVMFGANVVSGLLFIVGIALSNRRHAVLALLGSMVGTILSICCHQPRHLRLQRFPGGNRRVSMAQVAPCFAAGGRNLHPTNRIFSERPVGNSGSYCALCSCVVGRTSHRSD